MHYLYFLPDMDSEVPQTLNPVLNIPIYKFIIYYSVLTIFIYNIVLLILLVLLFSQHLSN